MSGNKIVLMREFTQINSKMFKIVWSDGKQSTFNVCDLQQNCPCMKCKETVSKKGSFAPPLKVSSVGNYALRVHFSSGCDLGIFTFQFLRKLHVEDL